MTLVAAFRAFGIPALVGDLLITTIGGKESQRKKLHILSDRLAIAWTGHLIAAEMVVETLQVQLGKDAPSVKLLELILTNPNFVELGSLQVNLIGWLVEDTKSHCFRWNSAYPAEVFYDEPMYDGSGDAEAYRYFGDVGIISSDSSFAANREQAVEGVLGAVTNLMKAEIVGPTFRHQGFGFAYEAILLGDSLRFEYIANILYYSMIHELDSEGLYLATRFAGKPIKVTEHKGNAIVWVFDQVRNAQSFHVIKPVGLPTGVDLDALLPKLIAERRSSPISADFYCAFLSFEAPGFSSPPIVEIVSGAKLPQLVNSNDASIFQLQIDPARIEWMYRSVKDDIGN